jgi:acid stress-induced BolA-like protein IbaG/YrbA
MGSTGLSEKAIEAFKKQQELEERRKKLNKLRLKPKEEKITINKFLLDTEEKFIIYLEEDLNLNIKKINITSNKEDFKFSDVIFKSSKISGTFNIKKQQFTYLKLGNQIEKNVRKSIISGMLISMESRKDNKTTNNKIITSQKKIIPQNTSRAISDRDNVKAWFESIDVIIDFADIEALDLNYNKFIIKDSIYDNKIKLSFIYYSDTDILENLKIQTGRTPLEILYKIKRTSLKTEIEKAILKIKQELENKK